jgi:hypothetical protein
MGGSKHGIYIHTYIHIYTHTGLIAKGGNFAEACRLWEEANIRYQNYQADPERMQRLHGVHASLHQAQRDEEVYIYIYIYIYMVRVCAYINVCVCVCVCVHKHTHV